MAKTTMPPAGGGRRGRGPGGMAKSKDPDYRATTVYVRRGQYADAKDILFRMGEDFSDLIGELLADWLKKQQRG